MALNPPRHWDFLLLGWSLSFGTPGQISVGAYKPRFGVGQQRFFIDQRPPSQKGKKALQLHRH
jgi:hypothetical protein